MLEEETHFVEKMETYPSENHSKNVDRLKVSNIVYSTSQGWNWTAEHWIKGYRI